MYSGNGPGAEEKTVATERGETWSGRAGFILATIGSAIGLGSIWKFPYEVGQNGGGAFVIFYLLHHGEDYRTFITRRFFRLWPVFAVCLALAVSLKLLWDAVIG